jgi:hypothetical protein
MNSAPNQLALAKRLVRFAIQIVCVFAIAVAVGAALNHAAAVLERSGVKPDFAKGCCKEH